MILANGRIVAQNRVLTPGWLRTDGTQIAALGEGTPPPGPIDVDLKGHHLVPGFVDMHVHGAAGHSFDEATQEAVSAITAHHRAHGTTTMLGSLVTAPINVLEDRIRALAPHVNSKALAGIHLEGPFLSAHHRGAHNPHHLRAPDPAAVETLLTAAPDALRMVTLAPELPGARDAIARIAKAGAVAAIGHTAADYETTTSAIEAGARVATHLYNGMPPIQARAPGPAAALLDDNRTVVELIADGNHLHQATLRRTAATAEGRFALITDAIAATGRPDGTFQLGDQAIQVRAGRAELADGTSLAGSTLTLDHALRQAVQTGITFQAALAAITSTPAQALGLADACGTIAPAREADLVILDDKLAVRGVMRHGTWVVSPLSSPGR